MKPRTPKELSPSFEKVPALSQKSYSDIILNKLVQLYKKLPDVQCQVVRRFHVRFY